VDLLDGTKQLGESLMNEVVFALVLAGGEGTRLWPLSRKGLPKQFLGLDRSGFSLLQSATRRARQLTGAWERVLVISQAAHATLVRGQLPDLPPANLILEPVGRSTAAAIGMGVLHVRSRLPDAVVAVLPTDHLFSDETLWMEAMQAAIQWAAESENLVAVGIAPDSPLNSYGYLHLGELLGQHRGLPIYPVVEYIEKPERRLAETFIQSGDYLWNTGTFTWKVPVFQVALKDYLPDIYAGLERIWSEPKKLFAIYPTLENISVDYGVMEKATNVVAVRGNFQRIDVGSLANLAQIWSLDEDKNAISGLSISKDSHKNVVYTDEGLVGLVGVEDLIVIRHKDVVLVCPKERAGEVKELFSLLEQRGLGAYQ
jgi:mannose-1-phosphate guanylyltransferase